MKNLIFLSFTISLIVLIAVGFHQVPKVFQPGDSTIDDNIRKKDRPDLAAQQNFEQTKDPKLGRPTPEVLPAIARSLKSKRNNPGSFQFPWIERGPNNVGGRTRGIHIDSGDPTNNTVWAGGVGGVGVDDVGVY